MTNVYADVRTRQNLPVIQRRMITRIRAALAEELGITNLADVHVFIRDFEVTGRPVKQVTRPDVADLKKAGATEASEEAVIEAPAVIPQGTTQPSTDHVETIQPISNLDSDVVPENSSTGENPQESIIVPQLDSNSDELELPAPSDTMGKLTHDEPVVDRPSDSAFA